LLVYSGLFCFYGCDFGAGTGRILACLPVVKTGALW
jgi:hypothetical protein